VVGERGWGDVLPLPPPAVRRPAAAAWIDRNRVVEEVRRGDLLPPPPLAEKHPAAAAWRDRDVVVGGRQVADLQLPPPMLARRPAAAAWRDGDRVVEKVGGGICCRPSSRPAQLARCAVRALDRVRARAPPLPPCLRGKTGVGGPEQAGGKWWNQSTHSASTARGSMVDWMGSESARAVGRQTVEE